jgi:hypothetical protein
MSVAGNDSLSLGGYGASKHRVVVGIRRNHGVELHRGYHVRERSIPPHQFVRCHRRPSQARGEPVPWEYIF